LFFLLTSELLVSFSCFGGGGPKNVLLVVNDNSPESQAIAEYYKAKRRIPERNILHIRCPTSEWVSKAECEAQIVTPIRMYLETPGIHDRIDYIVLTKGIPLKASYYDSGWNGEVSVASILTCVGVPSITAPCNNPYGPIAFPPAPVQYFTHKLSFSGKSYYIVARLDGYNLEQIFRMIDDAVNSTGSRGLFLLDGRYESDPNSAFYKANNRLREANRNLRAQGFSTYYDEISFDSLINEFVGGQQGLIGYFSWGSNESSYTFEAYTSNYFVPGSIADTYVSTSGRTFTWPPSSGQSLVADLIPQGVCAVNGYVSEPDVRYATYPNVLFSRYTQGYNAGESFFAATPKLYWKSVLVGDPLMAPYATPPEVVITNLAQGETVRGVVRVSASALDDSGINKVEFYVDDVLVATCAEPPYQFVWDTTAYVDGEHLLEVIAYEDTPVFTQGMAYLNVQVANTPIDVTRISDLKSIPPDTLVRLNSKVVIAGSDVFSDCVYLCESDRSAGVKVEGTNGLITGSLATVSGVLEIRNGELVITQANGIVEGTADVPLPLSTPNVWVANSDMGSCQYSSNLVRGLPNTGLLVRTWGWVTRVDTRGFYISDESRVWKGVEPEIKVSFEGSVNQIDSPQEGSFVAVTGVSCYTLDSERLVPTVRPRTSLDIEGVSPTTISLPAEATVSGWNMISIPCVLWYPKIDQVFKGVEPYMLFFDSAQVAFLVYDFSAPQRFPVFTPGLAFWFVCALDNVSLDPIVVANEPSTDFWISLPSTNPTMIGCPFPQSVRLDECLVSDGAECIPILEAVMRNWICPLLYTWYNVTQEVKILEIGSGNEYLEPWRGYWIWPRKPNLALIVPNPGSCN
jgi:uncharacterized protein (TIGR03790 family)